MKKILFFGILRNCEIFFDAKVLLCLNIRHLTNTVYTLFVLEMGVLCVWVGTIDSSSGSINTVVDSVVYSVVYSVVDSVVDSLSVDLWVLGVGVGVVVPGIRFGFSITLSKMVVWISRVSTMGVGWHGIG